MWKWNDGRAELYHYGILGMKWGVRRYQNPDGTLTAAGKARYTDNNTRQKKGLSDKQKKALKVGAAVVVTALAAYGGYRLYKSGKLNSFVDAGKRKVTGILGDTADSKASVAASELKKLPHKESVEEAIASANPTGNHYNCYNCVTATALRMCGIDAVAKGDTQGGKGRSFEDICKVFKVNENSISHMTSPNIERIERHILKKFKEGDVGAIGLAWDDPKYGDAHTLNWTIRKGKVEFMDGQIGKSTEILKKLALNHIDVNKEVEIARFANVGKDLDLKTDVDPDLLHEFV